LVKEIPAGAQPGYDKNDDGCPNYLHALTPFLNCFNPITTSVVLTCNDSAFPPFVIARRWGVLSQRRSNLELVATVTNEIASGGKSIRPRNDGCEALGRSFPALCQSRTCFAAASYAEELLIMILTDY
jgi:hypothetical protein